ncbi:MAG: hypothetical protein K5696_02175 [Lachnospiraceae bacterium]|nr:hypothetical protein [Lachnospiraceae bacterium]
MNFNPMVLLQIQQRFAQFQQDHPRFVPFAGAVKETALYEGTVIDIKVTSPEGKSLATNIRLTENDVETLRMLIGDESNEDS